MSCGPSSRSLPAIRGRKTEKNVCSNFGITPINRSILLRGHGPHRPPSSTRHSGHRAAIGGLAGGVGSSSHHGRRRGRSRQGRDRRHLAPVGVRRPQRPGHRRPHPAHSARRITGSLRGSSRRQPPSSNLSDLRSHGRCRLCRWVRALSHGGRRQGLRDRRGRGRVLGSLSGLPGAVPSARLRQGYGGQAPTTNKRQREERDESRGQRQHGKRTEVPVLGPERTAAERTATGGRIS